ncbi:MAG: phosphatidylinositol mannoside acyltransferase [Bifidobacteriaceae bacterium]|nr:phosphatidylinositol mannoside acyltransferase [Bifidobacteriaceae bacterium]
MNLAALAWKWTPRLPEPVARGGFALAGDIASWRRGRGVRRLAANLARVSPDIGQAALRRLTRRAMRAYLRYYREAFQLANWSAERIGRTVRLIDEDRVRADLGPAPQAVLALGHMGNWDLAGAWATLELAPITTVAEHLRPEAVFQDFLAMRRRIGLNIIPLDPGRPVMRELRRAADAQTAWLIPLLADRDLGRGGVEVDFFGAKALFAAGPAALALATGRPLYGVAMYRQGEGYALEFSGRVEAPPRQSKARQIEAMTQDWASFLEGAIRRHPADWHMLQKVFTADLDPERLKRARGASGASAASRAGGGAP